ncbi:MAG: hypothetical protein AAF196_10825 [Planctomycetota bacterium]
MIRRARGIAAALIAVSASGCGFFSGEPELDANAPLVAVVEHRGVGGDVSSQLLSVLEDVRVELLLNDRGYRAVPAAVTATILRSSGTSLEVEAGDGVANSDALAVLTDRGVDYLLLREVSKAGLGEDFRMGWSLVDVRAGESIWSADVIGGPGRVIGSALVGPTGLADEPQLSDDVRVGRGNESRLREIRTVTVEQQARDANERIAERLPSR